jgi:hypothetical protein
MTNIATGYFGVPGSRKGNFTVHAVSGYPRRTLCGTRMPAAAEFQWCCHGINYQFLECEKCKKIARTPILRQIGVTRHG